MTLVLDTIREAQEVAMRKENHQRERVIGQIFEFVTDSRGAYDRPWMDIGAIYGWSSTYFDGGGP